MRFANKLILSLVPLFASCAPPNLILAEPIEIGGSSDEYLWNGYITVTLPPEHNPYELEAIWSSEMRHETNTLPRKIVFDPAKGNKHPLKLYYAHQALEGFVSVKLKYSGRTKLESWRLRRAR